MEKNFLMKLKNKYKKKNVTIYYSLVEKKRKASHKFYKKAGLTIIGLGIGIIAYKKFKHKK